MKKITIIIALLSFTSYGQNKTKPLQTESKAYSFISNMQIDGLTGETTDSRFKLSIDDNKIIVFDQENQKEFFRYKVKYLTTENDRGNMLKWYSMYGNSKFNFVRIVQFSQPYQSYHYMIVVSKSKGGKDIDEFGFLCDKL